MFRGSRTNTIDAACLTTGTQVPYLDIPILISGYKLVSIDSETNAVDGCTTIKRAAVVWVSQVPYLDGTILATRVEIPSVSLKAQGRDVSSVAFQSQNGLLRLVGRRMM
jgi:hypothetical protein